MREGKKVIFTIIFLRVRVMREDIKVILLLDF